jgi:hypothetical protein
LKSLANVGLRFLWDHLSHLSAIQLGFIRRRQEPVKGQCIGQDKPHGFGT